MIGAVVFQVRAEAEGRLQRTHGRLLHAAFFRMLQAYSEELAACVHEEVRFKAFTVSELFPAKRKNEIGDFIRVQKGDVFHWRVTVLDNLLLQAVLGIQPGYVVLAGSLPLRLEKIETDGDRYGATGILDENELIAACLRIKAVKRITFQFSSPVSFRSFQDDYPFPLPQLIFGSIVDKWNLTAMPVSFERETVREAAAKLLPESWSGKTRQVYLKKDRGVTGFTGSFTFNISMLPQAEQQMLLLLAQFSQFSGVGRLTGQGLGQTMVTFQ